VYFAEKFNTLTDLGAAVLALPAAIVLIVLAALDGDAWRVVSISIYGLTLHPVLSGDAARALGLVAFRRGVGLGRDRWGAGTAADRPGAHLVDGDLPLDGVGGAGRAGAAASSAWHGGLCVGRGGRHVLYSGYRLLCARLTALLGAWCLAPVVIAGSAIHYVAILRYVL
jgi:hypothetical protein